jgi:hypothetical protein
MLILVSIRAHLFINVSRYRDIHVPHANRFAKTLKVFCDGMQRLLSLQLNVAKSCLLIKGVANFTTQWDIRFCSYLSTSSLQMSSYSVSAAEMPRSRGIHMVMSATASYSGPLLQSDNNYEFNHATN